MVRLRIAASAIALVAPAVALAHPHTIESNGQVIANGANHPAFVMDSDGNLMSCDDYTHLSGYGPAWYGIETAHHGPDASGTGKGDGCYQIEGNLSPLNPDADRNPAIR
jgi:hypothetical protein